MPLAKPGFVLLARWYSDFDKERSCSSKLRVKQRLVSKTQSWCGAKVRDGRHGSRESGLAGCYHMAASHATLDV